MKNLILFLMTVFLITSCSDDNDNEVNTLLVTPADCEAIQDRDECQAAGCILGGGSFNLLSSDKTKCLGKFYGSMCVAPKVDCNSNTVINWIYKELDDGSLLFTIGNCIEGWLDGWEYDIGFNAPDVSNGEDVCSVEDPDSLDVPYTGSLDNWYPFN